ncbi:MAG: metal-dependent transcriptional regulator [Propionicimonas sp.]
MSVSELSASAQGYLKAIWSLQEWSSDPVTPSAMAAKAGVTLSTVSEAVRKLAEQGLVEHTPYGAVTLTEQGRGHALAMVRRHRLIETFLVGALGYRWDQVHDEADSLEHAVSDFLIDRIDQFLGFPDRDPHGDPIPSADGRVAEIPEAILLSQLPADTPARVERISDARPELLQFFADHGIGIGARLIARPGAPFSESLTVLVDATEPMSLGSSATDAVWVTPLDPD